MLLVVKVTLESEFLQQEIISVHFSSRIKSMRTSLLPRDNKS